jgi:hypothetical protein
MVVLLKGPGLGVNFGVNGVLDLRKLSGSQSPSEVRFVSHFLDYLGGSLHSPGGSSPSKCGS